MLWLLNVAVAYKRDIYLSDHREDYILVAFLMLFSVCYYQKENRMKLKHYNNMCPYSKYYTPVTCQVRGHIKFSLCILKMLHMATKGNSHKFIIVRTGVAPGQNKEGYYMWLIIS